MKPCFYSLHMYMIYTCITSFDLYALYYVKTVKMNNFIDFDSFVGQMPLEMLNSVAEQHSELDAIKRCLN